jgi:hypothetical protein
MKNKHLLIIFVTTLLLGLIARYAPWFKSDTLQSDLIRVPSASVKRLVLVAPGSSELVLERSEDGWVAAQEALAVRTPDSSVLPLLAALEHVEALKIIHSKQPDSLWLLESQSLAVRVETLKGRKEHFHIGREVMENGQPATYLKIEPHEGVYLVKGHLRRLFSLNIDAFRSKTVLRMPVAAVTVVSLTRNGMGDLLLQKSDTAAWWQLNGQGLDTNLVESWLKQLQHLNGLPFATQAQEAGTDDAPALKIELSGQPGSEPVLLEFYGLTFRIQSDSSLAIQTRKPCLVHSSENPFNFFFIKDLDLIRSIALGLPAKPVGSKR